MKKVVIKGKGGRDDIYLVKIKSGIMIKPLFVHHVFNNNVFDFYQSMNGINKLGNDMSVMKLYRFTDDI